MKVLFGMALRQTTEVVESLLRLIDLDWAAPNFSTLSRRQKSLKVNIPYRCSQGPLLLLIDPTGAGDCFGGAFTALWFSGASAKEPLRFATAAGALAVTKLGPMEGASSLETLRASMAATARGS
jgi:sugar/nucleoside kinase (ribokinase family)